MARHYSHLAHLFASARRKWPNLTNDERQEISMQIECAEVELGSSVTARIGEAPLIRLGNAVDGLEGVVLLAKAEWMNPGGSVKDRAAWSMGRKAQAEGKLYREKRCWMQPAATLALRSRCWEQRWDFPCNWPCPPMFLLSENAFSKPTA